MNDEAVFLLDTVTVSKLTDEQLSSDLVQQNCKLPEEIMHELENNPKQVSVQTLGEAVNAALLLKASELLTQPSVQRLLDLYGFEGNGDVLLLAQAVLGKEVGQLQFFSKRWVIVSDDKKLIAAAIANGIDTLDTSSFAGLL